MLLHTIAIATPTGKSARFSRTRDPLDDGCDDLVLVSATRGKVHVTQEDKSIDLLAGQMCLMEMNVVGSADLNHAGDFKTVSFRGACFCKSRRRRKRGWLELLDMIGL